VRSVRWLFGRAIDDAIVTRDVPQRLRVAADDSVRDSRSRPRQVEQGQHRRILSS